MPKVEKVRFSARLPGPRSSLLAAILPLRVEGFGETFVSMVKACAPLKQVFAEAASYCKGD